MDLGFPSFRPSFRHNLVSAQYLEKTKFCIIYALILARSRLGLLHIIFHIFVIELWPLTDVRFLFRISFPLSILRTN